MKKPNNQSITEEITKILENIEIVDSYDNYGVITDEEINKAVTQLVELFEGKMEKERQSTLNEVDELVHWLQYKYGRKRKHFEIPDLQDELTKLRNAKKVIYK